MRQLRLRIGPRLRESRLRLMCCATVVHGPYQSGTDITVIRDYLGHASVSTTGRYVAADLQMKRDALDTFGRHSEIEPAQPVGSLRLACCRFSPVPLNNIVYTERPPAVNPEGQLCYLGLTPNETLSR